MGKGSDAPPAFNPIPSIQEQGRQNRINTFGPQGNVLFGTVGDEGQFVQDPGGVAAFSQESPFQTSQRNIREQLAINLGNRTGSMVDQLPGQPFSFSSAGVPSLIEGTDVQKSIFDQGRQLLDPVFAEQQDKLQQNLADRGIGTGTVGGAGETELNRFFDARNRAFTDLASRATQRGSDVAARNRRLLGDEALTERGLRFNELGALLQGGPVIPMPQFQAQAGGVDAFSPFALQNQNQQAAFASQQANQQSLLNNLFGLGGALGAAKILGPRAIG